MTRSSSGELIENPPGKVPHRWEGKATMDSDLRYSR